MARRNVWLRCGAGLGVCCLMAGCLFRTTGEAERPFAPESPKSNSPQAEREPAKLTVETQPQILSDYNARPVPIARFSSSLDPPLERVQLEITPRPSPEPAPEPPPAHLEPPPPVKEAPLVAALRCALEKHPREAQSLLEQYDKSDRALLLALLQLTAGVDKGELPSLPPEEVEQTLEHLHTLTQHLRPCAPLALGKVCFCRKIQNFGQYEPLPPEYQFQAGCEGHPGERVQIYAEVRNFSSQPRNGEYETILSSALEIHDAQRQPMVLMNLGACTDRSQTPRQDYFLNFQFHVPTRLPPGLYTLWVTVKDVTPAPGRKVCARVAKRSLDFKVGPLRP